jgi:hypothetical protein
MEFNSYCKFSNTNILRVSARIIIFYILFYMGLAAFLVLAMWVFMLTIKKDGPKYYLDDSIIGTSPGTL